MTGQKTDLSKLLEQCKYALKISFVFDKTQGLYHLAISYPNSFPTIIRFTELPPDLTQAVIDLLPEFDIPEKNKELSIQSLKDNGERQIKPVEDTKDTGEQIKKNSEETKICKSLF